MSQLGGQIQTIGAPEFLGVESIQDKNKRLMMEEQEAIKRHAHFNPGTIYESVEDKKQRLMMEDEEKIKRHAHLNPGTAYHNYVPKAIDDNGHKHHSGGNQFHAMPKAGDIYWPGDQQKPYKRGPLPGNYHWRTHFPNGKERKPHQHIPDSVVYDPKFLKKTNAQAQPHHVAHDHMQEITALKAQIAKLQKQNTHLENMLTQQKDKTAKIETKHKNNIAAQRGSGTAAAGGVGRGGRGGPKTRVHGAPSYDNTKPPAPGFNYDAQHAGKRTH